MRDSTEHYSAEEWTYMSPSEAKQVMELWAARQRQKEALQERITIQDLAEVTQSSPMEIHSLLREVRGANPEPRPEIVLLRVRRVKSTHGIAETESPMGTFAILATLAILLLCALGPLMQEGMRLNF